MTNHALFLLLTVALLFAAPAAASTYLDINDDAYALLSRLEAEGVITSGLLTTKPLSRADVLRLLSEAERNAEGRSEFIKGLVRELKQRVAPFAQGGNLKLLDTFYAKYVNTNADVGTLTYEQAREKEQALNANNDGDLYARGNNGRIGFTSRMEDAGRLSVFLNPEFQAGTSDGSDAILKKGYAVLDLGWDLVAGRDSQWWGPGYRGAILLTNNAEPFTMARITNPTPGVLPWILKYFGPYRFTFFVTRLEKDRADLPEPYLWGMRVNFKPHPDLEIGLERTALLGGGGRSTTSQTWLNSLTGHDEHCNDPHGCSDEPGDQRAGYDLKLTLPFEVQPFQLYMEADGEDSYGSYNLPRYWAYLYGLYLPRVLSIEQLEFRLEWARTFDRSQAKPTSWYLNGTYTSGYTYHGLIIGHSMGTDSHELFMELAARLPEKNARASIAFDRAEHNLSFEVNERADELSLRTVFRVGNNTDLDLACGYAWIDNWENAANVTRTSRSVEAKVVRQF